MGGRVEPVRLKYVRFTCVLRGAACQFLRRISSNEPIERNKDFVRNKCISGSRC